ncbi:YhcU family protein [Cytobacillus solani]|uniref:YhcU family protein n=1 Tax=Cytobacillus solani TaxID=1637975 RepID=UPI001152A808|nr:YhcU family protein [Cytobacillus solani]USK56407.1 YhcU family protein [Cytobacillus solani]
MKIVFASTPEQEEEIRKLVQRMYSTIFPNYFPDEDIKEFEQLDVLYTSTRHFEYFGTLKEAYQVIVSLQIITAILETEKLEERYEKIFEKNVNILQDFGLSFPFTFSNFFHGKVMKNDMLSMYTKAANELLI